METMAYSSAIGAGRRASAVLACFIALAACGGRDRGAGSGDKVGTGGGGGVATPAIPAAETDTIGGTTDTSIKGGQSNANRTDTSRAGELARAPRANPNAPPKPRLTPENPAAPADTNPTQPQPKKTGPPSEQPTQELHDKYHPAPKDTVSQMVYTGWKYFNLNCARCHGEDVTGTTLAPHLLDSFKSGKVDHAEFWRVVHGSRAEKGMPNWSGVIPDDQLQAIYEYVKGRSDGKLHPGRPAQQSG
jgi:mono/diheme cytochrome c family protein